MGSPCIRINKEAEVHNESHDLCAVGPLALLKMFFHISKSMFREVVHEVSSDGARCTVRGRFAHIGKAVGVPARAFAFQVLLEQDQNMAQFRIDKAYSQCQGIDKSCQGVDFHELSVRLCHEGDSKYKLRVKVDMRLPCALPRILSGWPRHVVSRATKEMSTVLSMTDEALYSLGLKLEY